MWRCAPGRLRLNLHPLRRMPRGLTQEEQALFLAQVADAAPLKAERRADLTPPPPKPALRNRLVVQQAPADHGIQFADRLDDRLDGQSTPVYLHPGVSRQVLRDLKRGRWLIQRDIDLHGYTRDAAREALALFLSRSLAQGLRCVRIVTGQGLRSADQLPVLRVLTRNWLTQCTDVLAYCEATPKDGGAGALIVLLRNRQGVMEHDAVKDPV